MIEIKSATHILRLFADKLRVSDIFKLILYTGYRGDVTRIPFYYRIVKGHSCETDLSLSMDEILASMSGTTRTNVRRGIKEGCEFKKVSNLDEFIPFYNAFCDAKGLDDHTSKLRMGKYKHLMMTKAIKDNQVLSMHANVLDPLSKVAFLLYSCSPRLEEGVDRKLIGWANKFLHYKDLEWLKNEGYLVYDWSGVCLDESSPKYSIGQFKLSFGGRLIDSYVLSTPLYVLAEKLRLIVKKILKRKNKS